MALPLRDYGEGGIYHREKRTVNRTFPRTHTKNPVTPKVSTKGSPQDVLKIGLKALAAYFGYPPSYAAVPVTALFSDFGDAGERRLNPDRAAQRLGYKNAKHQQMMIDAAKRQGIK